MIFFPLKILFLVLLINPYVFSVNAFNCRISIINGGSADKMLDLHCLENGKDVGSTSVYPTQSATFTAPLDNERIVATCDVTLGNLKGRFDMFDSNIDGKQCAVRSVVWLVNENGLFVWSNNKVYVLKYRWPR